MMSDLSWDGILVSRHEVGIVLLHCDADAGSGSVVTGTGLTTTT